MENKQKKPTYLRQRFLLSFIAQLKEGIAQTYLQKLVFLYTMQEKSTFYEFLPYKLGAYSFQLAEDVEILQRDKFISINPPLLSAVPDYQSKELFPIAEERGEALMRKAYQDYPYYTIKSVIVGRLFQNDSSALKKLLEERAHYKQNSQMLFTIGYEGKSFESFMNLLIKNDIHVLCDVRNNPYSRKFGFSKPMLEKVTKMMKIRYLHIPELGIVSEKRKSLGTLDDYQYLFDDYAKTLPNLETYLKNLYSVLCSHKRIALMCYEKEAEMCHRHIIRDYFLDKYSIGSVDL